MSFCFGTARRTARGGMRMVYKYSPDGNFEDYASGKVLYGMRGVPNFPVRLIQKIFLRAAGFCPKDQGLTV